MGLILDKVQKKFNNVIAVDEVSLDMDFGLYGLLGSNGAGKTTLMRMLCTILKPSQGKILYNGEDIFKLEADYRDILGYLPQDFGYYPDLKVKDYLKYIASLKGIKRILIKNRIDELLEMVGMQNDSFKKMKELSGGMKRRIGIAQSMLNNPKILILDEPTSGLDPMERIRFRNLIGQLANDRIVLLSTHIVSDIEAVAKRVFIMKEGSIIDRGTIKQLCNNIPQKVWIYKDKAMKMEKLMSDTSNRNVIIKNEGEYVQLRILSDDKPSENAISSAVTLEDVFLYHFGEVEENGND